MSKPAQPCPYWGQYWKKHWGSRCNTCSLANGWHFDDCADMPPDAQEAALDMHDAPMPKRSTER